MDHLPITKKFIEGYFTPVSAPRHRLSTIQLYMAKLAHDAMKIIIEAFPENKFYRDMGMLLNQDVVNYALKGRPIPENSDLLFGQPYELTPDTELYAKFGASYSLSVGGLSFSTEGKESMYAIFNKLAVLAYKSKLPVGDLTYMEGGAIGEKIIILSNSRYNFYNTQFVNKFIPHTYRASFNGGVTLQRHFIKF